MASTNKCEFFVKSHLIRMKYFVLLSVVTCNQSKPPRKISFLHTQVSEMVAPIFINESFVIDCYWEWPAPCESQS